MKYMPLYYELSFPMVQVLRDEVKYVHLFVLAFKQQDNR